MPAATWVQSGTGAAITGASGTVDISGCTAGNLLILQVLNDGNDTSTFGSISNVSNLAGTANVLSTDVHGGDYQVGSVLTGILQMRFGRVTANGTCSLTVTVGAGGSDVVARWHEFRDEAMGTTTAGVIENADDASNEISQIANTSTSMFPPDIITFGPNRLAVALTASTTNQTLDPFTGGSGAWVEPTAEFGSGTIGVIGIQTAPMTQGTISGATDTITSAPWCVLGFALKAGPDISGGPIFRSGRGSAW